MCLMGASRAAMAARSGSAPFGAVAQAAWLGQPAQASAFPARSLSAPGQSAECGNSRPEVGATAAAAAAEVPLRGDTQARVNITPR
jgi:hypothetical protein